jgi:putative addiction module component (TIGR02574 family)
MSETAERLKSRLGTLSVRDRTELAHFLLDSLDKEIDPDAEAEWDRELAERLKEIKSGEAVGEPAAKVFAELREKYS